MATATKPTLPRSRTPVSVVVPLYNEEEAVANLEGMLTSVEDCLSQEYDFWFILVDDGSKDATWALLNHHFGHRPKYKLIRQDNAGVASAILTGIKASHTEVVCSMDCDCTYDPHQLKQLIPMLTPGVDLVTGSPYHPLGTVRNVPTWRLALSKGSSFLYRCVLRHKLFTYTSCFRAYRRSAVADLPLTENGYLGIAEMLAALDQRGSTIREVPATLSVRVFGQSKMRIGRTIVGHVRLLTRLAILRLFRSWAH
jgi:glycosyltransferase involved in cell wall biosynthesis